MVNSDIEDRFIDRRDRDEKRAGLATPVFFWYDTDAEDRRITCGLAINTGGELLFAKATCSKDDNFCKAIGRKIVKDRIFTESPTHFVASQAISKDMVGEAPEIFAGFASIIPTSRPGVPGGRAYHAGQQFRAYRKFMEERARDIIDD